MEHVSDSSSLSGGGRYLMNSITDVRISKEMREDGQGK